VADSRRPGPLHRRHRHHERDGRARVTPEETQELMARVRPASSTPSDCGSSVSFASLQMNLEHAARLEFLVRYSRHETDSTTLHQRSITGDRERFS
jgi:hypothetical protein